MATNNALNNDIKSSIGETLVISHTAPENDTLAVEIVCNAAGFSGAKALDIDFISGAVVAGQEDAAIVINIDDTLSSGGEIYGIEVLTTPGLATTTALRAGALVNPLEQLAGTFADADSILNIAVDVTAALASGGAGNITTFVADNDTLTIGDAAKFEELSFTLDTPASGGGIGATFEFSTGAGTWASFGPTDGTNNMKNTGVIAWDNADVLTWAVGTSGDYLIRITRTKNGLGTTPIIDEIQKAAVVEYGWDKDAYITIKQALLDADPTLALEAATKQYVDGLTSSGTSMVLEVNQVAHALTLGMAIRIDSASTYVAAANTTAAGAEVIGMVSEVVDVDNFKVTTGGYISGIAGLGLAADIVFFLDTAAGLLTATEPTTVGYISRPVLVTDTTGSGFYLPYRGIEVGEATPPSVNTTTTVTQATHALTLGMAIRIDAANTYVAATNATAATAEVIGIVSEVVDVNNFRFVSGGQVTGISSLGLTADTVYFLGASAGVLTATEPTTAGLISKPTLITDTTSSGFYLPYRGIEVGSTASVSFSQKNLIIGGDFSLNPWQRGTTFAAAAHNSVTADRFKSLEVGTAVVTVQKTTDAPTVAEAGLFSQHCLEVDVTTADVTLGAGDLDMVQTIMEGYDFAQIAQRQFTISFWVKAKRTGIYCVSFVNSGGDRSYVAEYTVSVADTWEKKSVTVAASPSAGTWDYTSGKGIKINFVMACGTTFHTTKDAWQTGNFFATSSQVNAVGATTDYLRIQLVQIEAGNTATPFEIRSFGQELALCQRYFFKTYAQGTDPGTASSDPGIVYYYNNSTTQVSANAMQPVDMRANPTITLYNFSTGTSGEIRSVAVAYAGTAGVIGPRGFGIIAVTGVTAQAVSEVQYTATAEL